MAHINPAFVIATSELAIVNGQHRPSSKFLKGTRPGEPEGSTPPSKCKELKNMIRSKWKWSWLFNGMVVLTMVVVIAILEFDIIRFRALGYKCNDPSLSHKFRGDTISFGCIIVVSLLLPFVSLLLVEFIVSLNVQSYRTSLKKKTLCQGLRWYGQFFLGLLVLLFIIQLSKCIIGEPRPHFFDTCKPDKFNCTGYVTDYKCTNRELSKRSVRDSFRSFPSGHASLGFYVAIFLAWFFQSRIPYTDYLIVLLLQCLVISWGLLCSLTRITDHRHHWWDVLVGSILGTLLAIFTVKILCKGFRLPIVIKQTKKPEKITREVEKNTHEVEKNTREEGGSVNHWYRKMFSKSTSSQQADDKELREIK